MTTTTPLPEREQQAREVIQARSILAENIEAADTKEKVLRGEGVLVWSLDALAAIREARRAFADAPRPTSAPVVGEREAIARIIDPDAWAKRERHLQYADGAEYRDHREQWVDRANEDVESSLAKADAILAREQAASPPPVEGDASSVETERG